VAQTRRQFTREFKLDAIKQVQSGKSFARVAREREVHENVLRRWKREFDRHPSRAFPGLGIKVEGREAELERKIGQMTMEIDFLKKVLRRMEEERLVASVNGGRRSGGKSRKR
jgi:transposase